MMERFTADQRSLTRTYPIRLSATRRSRLDQFLKEQQTALGRLVFDTLSRDGQVDYILFRNYLQRERDQLAHEAQQMTEMAPLIPFANTLIALEEDRRRMIPIDP